MSGELDFRLLFEESPDVLLVLRPDAPRYTMVAATNSRWLATHTTAETLGRGLFEVFADNPDDPNATGTANLRASLERVLKTRQPDTMPVQKYDIRGANGAFEVRYWSPKNLPVLSPSGEVLYILHRVEDVTELVRANELGEELRGQAHAAEREIIKRSRELEAALTKLRQANVKLADLDRAKTEFFSNVSHEFRTPLTLMLGPLEDELRERMALPPERRTRLETTYRNSLRLLKLVNTLLDFSALEAGRTQASFTPTDLAALTRDLVSVFRSAADKAELELIVDCPSLPGLVYVDREMWEKIVFNLLSNALKHTFEGSIRVALCWRGDLVELAVCDTGVGIPEAELPRLFERFHRVRGAESRSHEGTGIGLALVKELASLHGGTVRAQSVHRRGSTFTVSVRTGRDHLPLERISETRTTSNESRSRTIEQAVSSLSWNTPKEPVRPASEPDSPRPRILWADDNADMLQYVSELLGTCYQVESVTDGEAALEAARANPPDLILTDVMMPKLDGFGLLKALRAGERTRQVPVILLSARAGDEAAVEGLDAGADDYLVKPFSARELLARVRTNVELSRLRRTVERELEQRVKERTAELAATAGALASENARRQATERRLEEQLARMSLLDGVLKMLSGINSAVVRIRDRKELLREACRLAVGVGGYAAAIVAMRSAKSDALQPVAWSGAGEHKAAELCALVAERAKRAKSAPRITDTVTQYLFQEDGGARRLIALPLMVDRTAIGILVISARDGRTIDDEELRMLREVAANLAFALQYLRSDSRVRLLSYFDVLTGLAKRKLFCDRLEKFVQTTAKPGSRRAVAVIDLVNLSGVNDSFGRHAGDHLLQLVADRLKRRFQDTELLAHFSGGTFAVVQPVTGPPQSALQALNAELTELFAPAFRLDGKEVPVVARSGVALYPDDGREIDALVQKAEAALRTAKVARERHRHFSAEAHSVSLARAALERKLRGALEGRQFELHYQAKVAVKTRRIVGVEALIRWNDPEKGLISPAEFLPILESSGLIDEVGKWVVERAASDCLHWDQQGLPPVRIAVNISPVQLRSPDFASHFLKATQEWATAACGLDIEITEGALVDEHSGEVNKLKMLRAAGVSVAIDDFGTGYSSLSRLSYLPIDTLKIDRSFVSEMTTDPRARKLVSSMISIARAFKMLVVAEGVETQDQLDALWQLGCDHSQGYLHCKPVTRDEFAHLLKNGRGRFILPQDESESGAALEQVSER